MKNLKYYLQKAQKEGWAMGQFNFSDFTQLKAIVDAAQEKKSPVIIGTSEGESNFLGLQEAVAMRDVLKKKTGLPIFLNLDHGKTFEAVKNAINAGYDMVHFDGSKLDLNENIKIAQKIVKYADKKGVVVEGEVGKVGNDSSKLYDQKFVINEVDLTDSEQAGNFVAKTKVGLLAVSVGNFHGIEVSGVCPNLKLDLIKDILKKVGIGLVLHGGSGTPEDDIKSAIKLGIVKININTDLRLAFSGNLRRALSNVDEIAPYKFLLEAKNSVKKVVEAKISLFGSQDKV